MIKDDCRTWEERNTNERRILRECRVNRALDEYEKFVSIKAYQFARGNHADREDFEQEGREAVWRAVMTLEAKGAEGTHRYFRVAIIRAMIDYDRELRRRNYQVWKYVGPPPRVKRYRYGGEWKGRMQYHGDKLTRTTYRYQSPLDYDELFSGRGE